MARREERSLLSEDVEEEDGCQFAGKLDRSDRMGWTAKSARTVKLYRSLYLSLPRSPNALSYRGLDCFASVKKKLMRKKNGAWPDRH